MFGSKKKLPAAARPKLDRDERVLAWSSIVDDGGAVVVTTRGVWLPGRDRIGWHEIHKATWSGSRLTVVPAVPVTEPVDEADGYTVMADDEPIVVALPDPGDVPAEIRDRVTRSVGHTTHDPLPAGGVRVVGRRVPGANGLTWHVRYDEGTDPEDPEVVTATEELVAAAREKVLAGTRELL